MANPAAQARANAQAKWSGATVVERGRKFIRHQHPTDPNRFMLDTQIGPMHYGASEDQEIDTAWVASGGAWDWEVTANDFHCFVRDSVPVSYRYEDVATGHFVELTVNAIEWVNDEGDSESAASFSQVTPAIDDDEIKWTDIAPGWDVTVKARTMRLVKLLEINTLANLGAPTIGGTNEALAFDFRFQKSSGLDVYIGGVLWDERANNPQSTADNIEFRDDTSGETVFWFKIPSATADPGGANEDDIIPTQYMKKAGNNLFVSVNTPWSWLQAATFPVVIDPTIDKSVAASSDDAVQVSGTVTLNDQGHNIDVTTEYGGFRFTGISGLSGATINTDTYITFWFAHSGRDEPDHPFWAEDAEAPATFTTTANDISDRTPTTATFTWTDADLGAPGSFSTPTPGLDSVIQELADSYDPSAIVIIMQGSSNSARDAQVHFYDHSTSPEPALHIDYTGAGGPGAVVQDIIGGGIIPFPR